MQKKICQTTKLGYEYLRSQEVSNILTPGEIWNLAHDDFLDVPAEPDRRHSHREMPNIDEIRDGIVRNQNASLDGRQLNLSETIEKYYE